MGIPFTVTALKQKGKDWYFVWIYAVSFYSGAYDYLVSETTHYEYLCMYGTGG